VVGVARDARHRERYSLGDIADGLGPLGLAVQRDVYIPYSQRPNNAMTVAVRAVDPGRAADVLRDLVGSLDPGLAVDDIRTLDDRLAAQSQGPAAIAALMTAYAAMAVLLAAIGLYGVITHAVHERTREIGIRIALGARTTTVVGLVAREGAWLIAAGLAAGLAVSTAFARVMRIMLYGVAPDDPLTLVSVSAALGILAVIAMLPPLLRAARIDPIAALRQQ
jgi:ABC-type antimicrobial peptide transport system permease subunit